MFQNIKTDVIYHKTGTDFEMEFNLCGCCRMRLLTDKSPDKKTFVHNLARAVSRSKIIIVTGNLFGDDGIIKITSDAISKKLQIIDNNQYNINSTEEILIIKDSTPLISKDGYFGGCIIESGPQTMILLSDNKNIRKNIMQTLIHPYIKEIYSAELSSDTATNNVSETPDVYAETDSEPEVITTTETPTDIIADTQSEEDNANEPVIEELEAADPQNEEIAEDLLIAEDNSEEINMENTEKTVIDEEIQEENSSIILTDGMLYEADDEGSSPQLAYDETYQLIAEDDSIELNTYNTVPEEIEGSGLISDEDFVEDEYKKHFRLDLPILVISIMLLVLLAFICYFIIYLPLKNGISSIDYIKEIFSTLFPK